MNTNTLGTNPRNIQLPLAQGFMTADTETGGFSPKSAPLLSIASLAADEHCLEVDGMVLLVRPPPGCLLELVDVSQPDFDPKAHNHRVGFLELDTGKTRDRNDVSPQEQIISAGAAFINGFVQRTEDGRYDLRPAERWYAQGMLAAQVDETLCGFIDRFFRSPPIAVGHNARFDRDFVQHHLPRTAAKIIPEWRCTFRALQQWYKAQGIKTGKGDCTLSKLAEKAGIRPDGSHEALADARTCLKGLAWLHRELLRLGVVGGDRLANSQASE